ncbi:MAG: hypothetical protein ACTHOB_01280 [Ginsengibacter sp.]
MEEKSGKKIGEVMQSLNGIKKASPSPFFFTRLEARMEREKSGWEKISSFIAKPVIAFACICLVIMINAWVIFFSRNSQNSTDQQTSELATTDEYNLVSSTFYEFVNAKP